MRDGDSIQNRKVLECTSTRAIIEIMQIAKLPVIDVSNYLTITVMT